MTERESEELYQELRRKLEDFGSPPPADLWQSIRAQLPAPPAAPPAPPAAARPGRRVRRRWLVLGLLLAGLAAVLLRVGSGWAPERPTPRGTVAASAPAAPSPRPAAPTAPARPRPSTTPPPADAAARVSTQPFLPSKEVAAASVPPSPPVSSATPPPATVAAPGAPRALRSSSARPRLLLAVTGITGTRRQPLTSRNATTAKAADAPGVSGQLAARLARRPEVALVDDAENQTVNQATAANPTSLSDPAAPQPTAPGAAARAAAAMLAGTAATSAPTATLAANPSSPPASSVESAAAPATNPAAAVGSALGLADAAGSRQGAQLPLGLRPVPLQQPALDGPAVRAVALDSSLLRGPRPSRWALEVLAGPALSYRRLVADSAAGGVARYERPALAWAGQAQVRYALTPRLHLLAGLGYAQYSSRLHLLLRQPLPDSAAGSTERVVRQRDVYRYVTVPVQAQLELSRGGRWRYGVLAGASLDVYAGSRSSSGLPCACTQQTWSVGSRGPYRQLGLSATLGLQVRYALTPRLTLLAQPQGRYSVFSITNSDAVSPPSLPAPGSQASARHPFAVGILTGFSFDLR